MGVEDDKVACGNCGKDISEPGKVSFLVMPFLTLFLGFLGRKGFCKDCSNTINAIGAVVAVIGLVVILFIGLQFF